MRRQILNMVATVLVLAGGMFLASDAQAVEGGNECHATLCATCKCSACCEANITTCKCVAC